MNINFFDDRKKGERDEVSRVYGHGTVKRSSEKRILKNYFQFISITSDGFPISLENSVTHPLLERCEGISRRWNLAAWFNKLGARVHAHSSAGSQYFCSHKRMHDWCPWLSCCVILSSHGEHECQICVNIRCTRRCTISAFFFAHLTGPLFRRAGARALVKISDTFFALGRGKKWT